MATTDARSNSARKPTFDDATAGIERVAGRFERCFPSSAAQGTLPTADAELRRVANLNVILTTAR